MNEVEYILRIVLKARDELAAALRAAKTELRNFAKAADEHKGKIDAFNESMEKMDTNVKNVTDRFKEWRAVIQGTGDDVDGTKKSFGELGREVEKTNKTTSQAVKTQAALTKQSEALRREARELAKTEAENDRQREYQIKNLRRLGNELERVSNKLTTGKRASTRAFDWSKDAREAADAVEAISKAEEAHAKQLDENLRKTKVAGIYQKDLHQQVRKTYEEFEKLNKLEKDGTVSRRYALSQYEQMGRDLDNLNKKITGFRESQRTFDRAERVRGAAQAIKDDFKQQEAAQKHSHALQLKEEEEFQKSLDAQRERTLALGRARAVLGKMDKGPLGDFDRAEARDTIQHLRQASQGFHRTSDEARGLRFEAERLSGALRHNNEQVGRSSSVWGAFRRAVDNNRESIASLDNQLRGVGLLLVVGFANQLITVLGGLAGSFVAVASSAAEAATAIGATFVAGIAQALPAIGLLGAAMFRVKAVMDAVNQAQLAQKQAFAQHATGAKRNANADDTLRNAQEGLANAQRQVTDAQKGLTKARYDARRELQDLAMAEKQADLAARGAALSQRDAQEALRQAIASGDVSGVQRAELDVLQAKADAEDKLRSATRARQDAEKGRRGGIEGTEGVQQAKRQLEDATRAAEKAGRAVQTAKRHTDEAARGSFTAAANLQFFLSQLSPAERRLYEAITKFQTLFREGPMRDITDNIINSFARSVEKVTKIIQMPEVLSLARRLSQQLARQMNRIFDAFTAKPMIDQFLRIAEEGRKNLVPVGDIAISLGKALANIAEEGGPALRNLLRFVRGLVQEFERLTNRRKDMRDFFLEGEKHFEAWVRLGLAVIRLFMALAGAGGARAGLRNIQDATKAIDDLTSKVHNNRKAVGKFFEDSRGITKEVVRVLAALGVELFKSFNPERIHRFADFLIKVIIPSLGDVIRFLGQASDMLIKFGNTPFGSELFKAVIALVLINKIFTSILGTTKLLGGAFKIFGSVVAEVAKHMGVIGEDGGKFAQIFSKVGPWAARLSLIVGIIVLLLQYSGTLDDVWDKIVTTFQRVIREVAPQFKQLTDTFKELFKTFSQGGGVLKFIGWLLSKVLISAIDALGDIFAGVFNGIFRILRGFIRIINGILLIFQGHFGKGIKEILGGIGNMFRGLLDIVWGVVKGIGGMLGDLGGVIVDGITAGFRAAFRSVRHLATSFLHWLRDHWKDILTILGGPLGLVVRIIADHWGDIKKAFRNGINSIKNFFRDLPGDLKRIAGHVVDVIVNAFKGLGKRIIDGILLAFKDPGAFGKNVANAFIDLLNKILPNKIPVPGAPDINLPDNPIPHMARGGRAPGKGAFLAVLHEDEHVWTADEVRRAGGHEAMYAMRRAYGGGGQGRKGRFQEGGAAKAGAGGGSLTISFEGGSLDDYASLWRSFWNVLVITARRGTNLIEAQFRDMRVNTARSADRMYRQVRGSLNDIEHSFDVRGKRIEKGWSDTWNSLSQTAYDGLFYIAHETNRALHGLEEKTVNFGLTPPKKSDGKASGGWIGSRGNRGYDRGLYPLGAGEAVLNWQHQKYVEPAMNAYYGHGLSTMFDRVHGYHAGGAGQIGFAGGREGAAALLDGHPGNVASGIIQLLRIIKRKWPGLVVTSTTDHSLMTTSGNISDHSTGHAVDIASGDYGYMNKAASWILSTGLYKQLKQGIHNPNLAVNRGQRESPPGIFGGAVWAQHANHIHLAVSGLVKAVGDIITSIAKRHVTGPDGAMKTYVQAALDKVTKAANKLIEDKTAAQAQSGDYTGMPPGGGGSPAPEGQHKKWIIAGLRLAGVPVTPANINAQYTLDMGESGGNPKIIQQIHDINSVTGNLARGIAQVIPPTFAAYKVAGHDDIFNPVDNIAASARYQFSKYGHLVGHPGYAKGGEIPGPDGWPVPILAHAREWILNPRQQSRMASMIGVSRAALKSMLGFAGSRGSFQMGGEVGGDVEGGAADEATLNRMFTSRALRERIRKIRVGIYNLTVLPLRSWEAVLTESNRAFRALSHIGRSYAGRLRQIHQTIAQLRRGGTTADEKDQIKELQDEAKALKKAGRKTTRGQSRLHILEELTKEGGVFDQMDAARDRYSQRLSRVLTFATYTFNRATRRVTRQLTDVQAASRELENTRKELDQILGEEGAITKALKTTNRRIRALRRHGVTEREAPELRELLTVQSNLRDKRDAIREAHAQQLQKIYEAEVARQQAVVDAINKEADKATGQQDIVRRIGEAIGSDDLITRANAAQRDILANQANQLEARIAAAGRIGNTEMVDQLTQQVADIRTQIFESLQQELRDAADRINTNAQRRLGHLDLGNRLLDALGTVGLFGAGSGGARTPFLNMLLGQSGVGSTFSRAGVLQAQGNVLRGQYQGLQGVLAGAQAQGNIQLIKDLTDQLAELEVSIAENTKAYMDARIDDVNQRHDYTQSVDDLKLQLLDLQGTISGQIDQAAKAALLQDKANDLAAKGQELQALLDEAIRDGNVQATQDLTKAVLENQIAMLQNTQALNEVTGAMQDPQSFSSSGWTWFREAIFSGMGQVLPQYNPANAMTGINTGAVIQPASISTNSTTGGDVNITLNEAGRPVDLQEVSSVVTFASKTAQ